MIIALRTTARGAGYLDDLEAAPLPIAQLAVLTASLSKRDRWCNVDHVRRSVESVVGDLNVNRWLEAVTKLETKQLVQVVRDVEANTQIQITVCGLVFVMSFEAFIKKNNLRMQAKQLALDLAWKGYFDIETKHSGDDGCLARIELA